MRTTQTRRTLAPILTLTLTLAGLNLPGAAARADEPRFEPSPSPVTTLAPGRPEIIELQAVDREQPLRANRPGQVSQVHAPAPMGAPMGASMGAPVGVPMIPVQQRFGYVPCDGGVECMIDKHALKLALRADPDYGAATGKMVAGVVVTAVGGAAAVLLGFASLLAAMEEEFCYDDGYGYDSCQRTSTPRDLGIASLVSLGVGLAVGLPVLISGATDRKAIRERLIQQQAASQAGFGLAGGPGQAGLGVRYTF